MTDAYQQGQQAAMRGDEIWQNPYDQSDAQFEQWEEGFFDFILSDTNDSVMSA